MPKLQEVKRGNGSIVQSVNIPKELSERIGWQKGDELIFQAEEFSKGLFKLIVLREDDTHGKIRVVQGQEEGMAVPSTG